MKNLEAFEDLGWTESTLSNMKLEGTTFSLIMTDILSYVP